MGEWIASLLDKGLKVNAEKSKVMAGSSGGKIIVNYVKWPCRKGVQVNSLVVVFRLSVWFTSV